MEIRIGNSISEYLVLDIIGRKYPSMTDNSLLNCLDVNVTVFIHGFTGQIREELSTDELYWFEQKLENLFVTLNGDVVLDVLDKWIFLKISGDGKGHISCKGKLIENHLLDNFLSFTINFDQTFLPDIISALKEVLVVYPIIG